MFLFYLVFKIFAYFSCTSNDHCISCDSYGDCDKCEDGYKLTSYECSPCHSTCKQCSYATYSDSCTECYDGYYLYTQYDWSTSGYCYKCSDDGLCSQCNQDSSHTCTKCFDGSYLNKKVDPPKCEKCYNTCLTCTGTNENECTSCIDEYYLAEDNTCKHCGDNCKKCKDKENCEICNEHYYPDSSNKCQLCDTSCKNCHGPTMNDCDDCYDGFYNSNGLCRACDPNCKTCIAKRNRCTSCNDGYYLDLDRHLCLKCDKKCKTCKDNETCITCADGYYLDTSRDTCEECGDYYHCQTCFYKYGVQCYTCQPGYYPVYDSYYGGYDCKKSYIDGCYNATDEYTCVKCYDGYFLNANKCTKCDDSCLTCDNSKSCSSCPPGNYIDKTTNLCANCSLNCKECTDKTNCIECVDKYYPSGGVCKQCDKSCQKCRDDTNACVQCATGYYFNPLKRCERCADNCDVCTDSTHCTDCSSEFFLLPNGTCSACSDVCYECTGPTADDCIECDPGYYLSKSFKACIKCHEACSICTGPNNDECSKCAPGYYMYNSYYYGDSCVRCESGCKNCTSTTNCVDCLDGYYLKNANCERCPIGCKSCTSAGQCTQCFDGFNQEASEGGYVNCSSCPSGCSSCSLDNSGEMQCNKCMDGHYLSSGRCPACKSPCNTCKSESICTSCIAGHLLDSSSSCNSLCSSDCLTCEKTANTCTSCNDGYLLNGTKCVECPQNCKTCEIESGKYICTRCLDGFYYDYYYEKCQSCSPSCATCDSDSTYDCFECKDGYFKYSHDSDGTGYCYACDSYYGDYHCAKCTSDCTESSSCKFICLQCQDGYYANENKNECNLCDPSCKSCDGPTDQHCIECQEGLFLTDEGKCSGCDESCATCEGTPTTCTSCKSHQYLTSDGKCKECSDSCAECKDENTCTKCLEYQFMHEGKCLKSCLQIGEGWGADDNFNCIKCNLDNCKVYDDSCQCTECNEGYYIISDDVTLIEYCLPCQLDNCKACNGINKNDCTECKNGYELQIDQQTREKVCVSICGDGYFVNISNQCEKCRSPCKKCSGIDGSICNQCQDGYFIDGTSCSVLPTDCFIFKHCENENKGEEPVQVTIEKAEFNSFKSEKGGGALRLINCGLKTEEGTSFNECQSEKGGGGAIFILNEKNTKYEITLKDLAFTSCKAAFGGAIYIYSIAENSPVIIENCNFFYNEISNVNANDDAQFYGGSALYLTVRTGSVDNCQFKSKVSANMIKATDDFDTPPEGLMILEKSEYEKQSTVIIKKCTFENAIEPNSIYVVEKHILSSDVNDNTSNESISNNLFYVKSKSNQFAEKIVKQPYNQLIEFRLNSNNRKETKIVLSFLAKCLIGLFSFGLVALIIIIITKIKFQSENERECGENNSPIDSLKE